MMPRRIILPSHRSLTSFHLCRSCGFGAQIHRNCSTVSKKGGHIRGGSFFPLVQGGERGRGKVFLYGAVILLGRWAQHGNYWYLSTVASFLAVTGEVTETIAIVWRLRFACMRRFAISIFAEQPEETNTQNPDDGRYTDS